LKKQKKTNTKAREMPKKRKASVGVSLDEIEKNKKNNVNNENNELNDSPPKKQKMSIAVSEEQLSQTFEAQNKAVASPKKGGKKKERSCHR